MPGWATWTADQAAEWISANVVDLASALNVTIPVGNHLNYNITTENPDGAERCVVVISATFPLFRDGSKQLIGEVKRDGQVYTFTGG